MSQNNWDLDELLNFDYGKPASDGGSTKASNGPSSTDEARLYAELRKQRANESAAQEEAARLKAQELAKLKAQEAARHEAARQEEIRRRAQESIRQEIEKRKAEEAARQAELQRRAQIEAARQAELQRSAQAEALRQEEIRKRALEAARQEELQRSAQAEAARQAELQKRIQEDAARKQTLKLQAMEAAYERYRQSSKDGETFSSRENRKAEARAAKRLNSNKRREANKIAAGARGLAGASKGSRLLAIAYTVILGLFAFIMTIMNVLPMKYLILLYVVLAMLSVIIVTQLVKPNIKKWARRAATVTAVFLIVIYGVGAAYAMGTLSFLSSTTVKNDSKVGSITRDPFNVVMTGMDVYGYIDEQGRSDVNMIVTVNPQTETILLTSIPRDYQIRMPDKDYATDKLTHTGFYSIETTILAEEDLLDFEANYYVKVNFTTVKAFIYAVGGIDVYSEYEFTPEKKPDYTVKKGWNHMNGKEALAFARERHAFKDGDNQRIKNQQAVFVGLIKSVTSGKTMALKYSKILSSMKDYFEMSISSSEIRSLVKLQLAKNPKWKIYKNTLYGDGAYMTTYTGGSQELYVMQQNQTSIDNAKALMNAVMNGEELEKDENGNTVIKGAASGTETTDSGTAETTQ